jgi:hypothetical protein
MRTVSIVCDELETWFVLAPCSTMTPLFPMLVTEIVWTFVCGCNSTACRHPLAPNEAVPPAHVLAPVVASPPVEDACDANHDPFLASYITAHGQMSKTKWNETRHSQLTAASMNHHPPIQLVHAELMCAIKEACLERECAPVILYFNILCSHALTRRMTRSMKLSAVHRR